MQFRNCIWNYYFVLLPTSPSYVKLENGNLRHSLPVIKSVPVYHINVSSLQLDSSKSIHSFLSNLWKTECEKNARDCEKRSNTFIYCLNHVIDAVPKLYLELRNYFFSFFFQSDLKYPFWWVKRYFGFWGWSVITAHHYPLTAYRGL